MQSTEYRSTITGNNSYQYDFLGGIRTHERKYRKLHDAK